MRRFFLILLITALIFPTVIFVGGQTAYAGKLKQFEEKVESKPSESSSSGVSSGTAEVMTRTWWDILSLFMMSGLNLSLSEDGTSMSEYHRALKTSETSALPTIKLEGNYHYVVNHIHGYDVTATFGYLMFGADCNLWHLFERNPDDQLKFISPHLLLRIVPFPFMEVDLALGSKLMMGDHTNQGFEAGVPAYFFFGRHFTWDVKTYVAYINGNDLWDVGSGISFRYKFIGVRAGYRMIEVGGSYIHGPQVGLFGQW